MKVEDVKVAKGPLVTASAEQVRALEAELWLSFPEGYREYISRLGEGSLCGFIQIHPPWRIEKDLDAWRRLHAQYWFWDEGPQLLPQKRAVECVCIGNTLDGDQLVFHPSRRDRLFVLPRHHREVFEAGPDLLSAVDWMLRSGHLIEAAPRKLRFESFDSRLGVPDEDDDYDPFGIGGRDPAEEGDPAMTSMDDLIGTARVWADRWRVQSRANRFFAAHLPNGMIATRRCEALVFEADAASGYHLGYLAIYQAEDANPNKVVAPLAFHWSEDGSMGMGPLS